MRVGPLGFFELFFVLFVYLLPVALIIWFLVATVQHRRRLERSLERIAESLEHQTQLNPPQPSWRQHNQTEPKP